MITFTFSYYLKVNAAIAILVKDAKYLLDKDLSVASWQDHGVHVQDLGLGQLAIGAIGLLESESVKVFAVCFSNSHLEPLVPFSNLLLVVSSVPL